MRTMTFFSYKGGTGRSLAVANAACYLAQLGFKSVVLDFDLEAPGLCYKFTVSKDGAPVDVKRGLVDYLFDVVIEGKKPGSILEYTKEIPIPSTDNPLVTLFPAGRAPTADYWEKLCRINWHDLFYSPDPKGVKLFLDLKSRIEESLAPDFLLIDSRTGVTEMGGVATTILPDAIVCIFLNNRENLDGIREVLRSLNRWQAQREEKPIPVLATLSRVPEQDKQDDEETVIKEIKEFLSSEANDLNDTLSIENVFVLHSEPALQLRESLRVGRGVTIDESILLRDYLRLFSYFVPAEMIRPKIAGLFQAARDKIWTDPETATKEVEQLAEFYGRPEGFRELLQFYIIRNMLDENALKVAQRYWELTNDAKEPSLKPIVRKVFLAQYSWRYGRKWRPNLEFIESVWRATSEEGDLEFGRKIGDTYSEIDEARKAVKIYLELINLQGADDDKTVSRTIQLLLKSGDKSQAKILIEQFKESLEKESGFLSSWAEFALDADDTDYLALLAKESVLSRLIIANSSAAIRIAKSQDKTEIIQKNIGELFNHAIRKGPSSDLFEVGKIYEILGKYDEFEEGVKRNFPEHEADRFLHEIRMRFR